MNFLRNIYGKLAVFYLLVSLVMIYLAYSFESKMTSLDEFYGPSMELHSNAESNGSVSENERKNTSFQEGF